MKPYLELDMLRKRTIGLDVSDVRRITGAVFGANGCASDPALAETSLCAQLKSGGELNRLALEITGFWGKALPPRVAH